MWVSVEVVVAVCIVQCHAIIHVVIGVRVLQCHAIIHVVIGVRVMLCYQAMDNSGFSIFLNFSLRVPILILLSCCINSSSLFPVAILYTLLHRENTSFEVWYLHFRCTSTLARRHLLLHRIASRRTDTFGNRSITTSHMVIAVVWCLSW